MKRRATSYQVYSLFARLHGSRTNSQGRCVSGTHHHGTNTRVILALGTHGTDDGILRRVAATARRSSRGRCLFLALNGSGCGGSCRRRRRGSPDGRGTGGTHGGGAEAVFGLDVFLTDCGGLGDIAAAACAVGLVVGWRSEGDAQESCDGEETHVELLFLVLIEVE